MNNQVTDAYVGKMAGKTLKNASFNQSKYMSGMNHS
jgi:hypothetical protein